VLEDSLDFDTAQISTSISKSIKIINPSEVTLLVQLFVAPSTYSFDDPTVKGDDAPIMEYEFYADIYCHNKLKESKHETVEVKQGNTDAKGRLFID